MIAPVKERLLVWLATLVEKGQHLRRERRLNAAFLQMESDVRRLRAVAEHQGWDLSLLIRKSPE